MLAIRLFWIYECEARLSSHFNAPLPAAAPVANEACSR
jgi:hypothetical protein